MKKLIRSNSETNFFFHAHHINLINTNINNLKTIKNLQNKEEFVRKSKNEIKKILGNTKQKKSDMLLNSMYIVN